MLVNKYLITLAIGVVLSASVVLVGAMYLLQLPLSIWE
jgi:hypothetical protein